MPSHSNDVQSTKPVIILHEVCKTFNISFNASFKQAFIAAIKRKNQANVFQALKNVSISVDEGESVAVLGHNGSGKSTTLKLISGVMQPDSGWVRTRGRIGGLLEVGAGFHPDMTGRDNIFLNAAILGMSKKETLERFAEIVEFSGIQEKFLDTEVKRYSSGMRSRLGFAVAVHTNIDVLLVDEVLSVGDRAFQAKCARKLEEMREQQKTMFIVSHNLGTVQKLCERGIVLDKGQVIFDGEIKEAVELIKQKSK